MKSNCVKLIFKDIYYYKTKDSPMYKGMHNLSDVYIKKMIHMNIIIKYIIHLQ